MKFDIFHKSGKKSSKKINLNDDVFCVEPNQHSVYLAINSEIIVNSFVRTARLKMLDTYLVKRGEKVSGEIFLRINNLEGFSRLYTYKKTNVTNFWETYGTDKWEENKLIESKIEKAIKIDEDIWVLELEDREGRYPDF